MAYNLGLNVDSDKWLKSGLITEEDAEVRKVVWYGCWTLDKYTLPPFCSSYRCLTKYPTSGSSVFTSAGPGRCPTAMSHVASLVLATRPSLRFGSQAGTVQLTLLELMLGLPPLHIT